MLEKKNSSKMWNVTSLWGAASHIYGAHSVPKPFKQINSFNK